MAPTTYTRVRPMAGNKHCQKVATSLLRGSPSINCRGSRQTRRVGICISCLTSPPQPAWSLECGATPTRQLCPEARTIGLPQASMQIWMSAAPRGGACPGPWLFSAARPVRSSKALPLEPSVVLHNLAADSKLGWSSCNAQRQRCGSCSLCQGRVTCWTHLQAVEGTTCVQ